MHEEFKTEHWKGYFLDHTSFDGNGHWLWTGSLSPKGYGIMKTRIDGKNQEVKAHRYSFWYFTGQEPVGDVHHKNPECGIKLCVSMEHLEDMSHGDHSILTHTKTHCKRGHELKPPNLIYDASGQRHCFACRELYTKLRDSGSTFSRPRLFN